VESHVFCAPSQSGFSLRVCTILLCLNSLVLSGCGGTSTSSGGSGGGNSGGAGADSGSSAPPPYPGNRTAFIRTGDTPSSAVYDSLHQLVFASEPNLGLVDAVSVPGGQIMARIPVPGVEALGLSADDSKILEHKPATSRLDRHGWVECSQLADVADFE